MNTLESYPDLDIGWEIGVIPEVVDGIMACDTETSGLNPYGTTTKPKAKVFLHQFANCEGHIGLVPHTKEYIPMLQEFYSRKDVVKIYHNLQFDKKLLQHAGFTVEGRFEDTLLAARCINEYEKSYKLEELAKAKWDFLDVERTALDKWFDDNDIKDKNRRYDHVPEAIMYPYAAVDPWNVMQLYFMQMKPIKEMKRTYRRDVRCAQYMIGVEDKGVLVDKQYFRGYADKLKRKLKRYEKKIKEEVGRKVNTNSPIEVGHALFKSGETCQMWAEKGEVSISKEAMGKYTSRFAKYVQKSNSSLYRKGIIESQILPNLDKNNFIHTNFNLSKARTGRFTSSDPALQNIEVVGGIRDGFIALPDYHLFYFDYSQIEVRLFAHYGEDERYIQGYCNDPDFDVHQMVADILNLERYDGKTLNFTMLYGAGAKHLADVLNVSLSEAKRILRVYHSKLPSLNRLKSKLKRQLFDCGYIVDAFGRRYRVPPDMSYKAVNALIQGCACNLLKIAMLRCGRILEGTLSYMIQNIHDELVFYIHDSEWHLIRKLKHTMEDFHQFLVPIEVDVDYALNWGDKKVWTPSSKLLV